MWCGLLDALGIDRCAVVGASAGGPYALARDDGASARDSVPALQLDNVPLWIGDIAPRNSSAIRGLKRDDLTNALAASFEHGGASAGYVAHP